MPRTMDWTADMIRQLRANAQMTQLQLARWLGVTVKQVKHLENRRRNPSGPVGQLLNILREELGDNGATRTPSVQVIGSSSPRPKPESLLSVTPESGAPPASAADAAMVWDN